MFVFLCGCVDLVYRSRDACSQTLSRVTGTVARDYRGESDGAFGINLFFDIGFDSVEGRVGTP